MGFFLVVRKTNQAAFLCICSNQLISVTVFGFHTYLLTLLNPLHAEVRIRPTPEHANAVYLLMFS